MKETQTMQEEVKTEKQKSSPAKREITVKANKKGKHVIPFLNVLRVAVAPFLRLVKPFRYYGNYKIKDGACVYICNHYGLLDPLYPALTTWEGIHFMAKKEVGDIPVVGWVFRKVKGIFVNRDGNDVRAILDCFKCLKNNEKICIFPEGTRNKTGVELQPFQHGAAAIAIKAKVPVVPMMLYKKPRFFRMTHVLVGEPVELSEYYGRKLSEEDYREADQKLYDILLNLRKEHAAYLENKKAKKVKA